MLIIGGALLGVVLGAAVRFGFGSGVRLKALLAIAAAAGVIGLFPVIPGHTSRLPQLFCYVISVLTGYIAIAMLDANPGEVPAPEASATPICNPIKAAESPSR
jgi:hypothetical protein